jgi:hypothetical protein
VQTGPHLLDDTGRGWADTTTVPVEFDTATRPSGRAEGHLPRTDDLYTFPTPGAAR